MEANGPGKKCITILILILFIIFNLGCFGSKQEEPKFMVEMIYTSQDVDYDEVIQINLTKIEIELKDGYEIIVYEELEWENGFVARALDHGNETYDVMTFWIYAENRDGNRSTKFEIYYNRPIKNSDYIDPDDNETIEEIKNELRERGKDIADVANVIVDTNALEFNIVIDYRGVS